MAIAVLKLNGSEMMKIQGQKYYNRIRKIKIIMNYFLPCIMSPKMEKFLENLIIKE